MIIDDRVPLALQVSLEETLQKVGFRLSISAFASGSIRMVSIRPARLSATRGSVSTFAEPVSRNLLER